MKHTLEGFKQSRLVELQLGYVEAALLRWLVDFSHTGKMREITDASGKRLWWVKYEAVSEDLPVLGITAPDVMRRRFAKLVSAKVLVHQHVQQRGRFSYYGFGPEYESLIADTTHQTEKSDEPDDADGHTTEQSSDAVEAHDHPTEESGEGDAGGVHSTDQSPPIRPFGRHPSDRTVGSNDSSSRDPSSRDTEDSARVDVKAQDLGHLTDHMRLAVAWYKRRQARDGLMIMPSGEDFVAAAKALERAPAATIESAIDPYFEQEWWFTKDKRTGKPTYAFRGFLTHFPTILTAMADAKQERPARPGRVCSKCGAALVFGTARFIPCSCGRAYEIADGGALVDVTDDLVKA